VSTPYRVHFVCTGNICRSPMADVITRAMLAETAPSRRPGPAGSSGGDAGGRPDGGREVVVDSSGTDRWHVGEGADPRTVRVLAAHGYDGSAHRAQQFDPAWFPELDLVVALDHGHERILRSLARTDADRAKVRLLREYDERALSAGSLEVDDPWYGDQVDFEECLEVVEAACAGLVGWLEREVSDQPADSV
jgi:protein-tyrosine phosphatase